MYICYVHINNNIIISIIVMSMRTAYFNFKYRRDFTCNTVYCVCLYMNRK